MGNLISYLFETNAVRVCPDNKPFWYTSGKIGPYFINTHFLYGNENEATNLLKFIDLTKYDKLITPQKIFEKVLNQYNTNTIYNDLINQMIKFINSKIDINLIDYISGGERRDWFFSNIIAYILKKPHISIFKDLSTVVSNYNFENTYTVENLNNKKVLHIADLITEASSYIRAWVPAIENLGAKVCWSTVVVDRMQGGSNKLESLGISSYSMIKIDYSLFEKALEIGVINSVQLQMLSNFIKDPDKTMKDFLIKHPEFLKNSLNSDEKTARKSSTMY